MAGKPTKAALRTELVAQLEEALTAAVAAHAATVDGATHAEAKPENDKDTRALEQQYLARGQAQRVVELQEALLELARWAPRRFGEDDPIALGALVTIEEDGDERTLFVAPAGGGNQLADGIQVVTPRSPLGQLLLGKHAGDEVELRAGARARTLEIVAVA
ncbi:MAG: GreA/GreB family elongation factor [Deltaproteobacteria bacterium]|nr:GreA/GreB family elongation factor [Kofleriaceae bacterium]